MTQAELLAEFEASKTPKGYPHSITNAEIKPSKLKIVDGTVTVPPGEKVTAGTYNVTWNGDGTVKAIFPLLKSPLYLTYFRLFKQVAAE